MDGKAAIYDSKSDKWTQVTDLRGIDVYTIDGGNPYIVEQLGDLPDSVTTTKPEPPADICGSVCSWETELLHKGGCRLWTGCVCC